MIATLKLAGRVIFECTLIASLLWLVVYVFSGQPPTAAQFATVWVYAVSIATPAYLILERVFPLQWGTDATQWTIFALVLTAIAVVGSAAGTFIVMATGLETRLTFGALLAISLKISLVVALLIGVVHAMIQRLKDRLGEAERKLQAQALEHERALKLASEARLAALEAQVNPHFLFNTLNTVSALIPDAPDRAERLIERLSALLRFSLDSHHQRLVPIEQEMNLVDDYLEIQRSRFGDRLRFSVEVDDNVRMTLLPPFAVQTLIENSVKFAVTPERHGGEVRVRARRNGSGVRIEVADQGPGFSTADIPIGHGLDNLRNRLVMTFGQAIPPLDVTRVDEWTIVGFHVPG
jgi:LytS/YehU family sensor histidine kinase